MSYSHFTDKEAEASRFMWLTKGKARSPDSKAHSPSNHIRCLVPIAGIKDVWPSTGAVPIASTNTVRLSPSHSTLPRIKGYVSFNTNLCRFDCLKWCLLVLVCFSLIIEVDHFPIFCYWVMFPFCMCEKSRPLFFVYVSVGVLVALS